MRGIGAAAHSGDGRDGDACAESRAPADSGSHAHASPYADSGPYADSASHAHASPYADSGPVQHSSFKVDAGSTSRVTIDAFAGNEIQFEFRADLAINVLLMGPDGVQLGRWDRVDSLSVTSVTARSSGDHEMIFDNSFSLLTPKSVTLAVRVVAGR